MSISNFTDLLNEARRQTDPQRILFVFTQIEPPENPDNEQQQAFEQGHGGALIPLACVDKALGELNSFTDIATEAQMMVPNWDIVFVAALSGQHPIEPTPELAETHLNQMIEMIKIGRVAGFIAFDRNGDVLLLDCSH